METEKGAATHRREREREGDGNYSRRRPAEGGRRGGQRWCRAAGGGRGRPRGGKAWGPGDQRGGSRGRCFQRICFSNRHSLGHLLMANAVLRDGRRVLRGRVFLNNIPWGISSWWTLCCGTYAVLLKGVLLKYAILGTAPHGGRCVVRRTLCTQRKSF